MNVQEDRKRSIAADRGRVSPRHLAHIVRRTARFEELVRWYCTVLGAEVGRFWLFRAYPGFFRTIGEDANAG